MKDEKKRSNKKESCTELKNIKYQNMLLSNSKIIEEPVTNISNIDNFLNKEVELNTNKPWNKLGRSAKIALIKKYAISYSSKHKLSEKIKNKLEEYLLLCIDRKKLQKIKDIQYDIEKNEIINIPLLFFNKQKEIFILKRADKKHKISSHLAPKNIRRGKKTLKHLKDDKKSGKAVKSKTTKTNKRGKRSKSGKKSKVSTKVSSKEK